MKHVILFATLAAAAAVQAQPVQTPAATEPSWARALAEVQARTANPGASQRAKNIILFIGDGMGVSTVTAARIFEAQMRAKESGGTAPGFEGGEENRLSFERLPHTALVKTYNTNAQVPDSAGTASAMVMGAKTRIGAIGMLPGQQPDACKTPDQLPPSIARLARDRGMGVGVVTTTRITHATPAVMYGHVPDRNWEATDRAYPAAMRESGCPDLATQLINFPGGIDVALGGGVAKFKPQAAGGSRDDGRDLIAEWQAGGKDRRFVGNTEALARLDRQGREPVLGLFNASHLDFHFDADPAKQPSLATMTEFAIDRLEARARRTGKGYVLMVEGGRIDHAHHLTNAYRALDETVEFARAVEAAMQRVSMKDTLILVTADHGHVFTIAGYPPRGNNILGFIRPVANDPGRYPVDADGNSLDRLGRPMPTLGYANGPESLTVGSRVFDSKGDPTDPGFLQPKTFNLGSETHSGEDVPLYAAGPGSALVTGTIEQNSIFHIMAHALGWR